MDGEEEHVLKRNNLGNTKIIENIDLEYILSRFWRYFRKIYISSLVEYTFYGRR